MAANVLVCQGKLDVAGDIAARAVTCFRRCGRGSILATATALYNLAGISKRQVGVSVSVEGAYLLHIARSLCTCMLWDTGSGMCAHGSSEVQCSCVMLGQV